MYEGVFCVGPKSEYSCRGVTAGVAYNLSVHTFVNDSATSSVESHTLTALTGLYISSTQHLQMHTLV